MTDSAPSDASSADVDAAEPLERRTVGADPLADVDAGAGDAPTAAASEAFQTLASEVRVAVLVELLDAERRGELPRSFSDLQDAADVDSSAGFAYHLRQLSDQFVEESGDGYELTPAGRAAARAITTGAFTADLDPDQAS